jgi:hypothetical protein
MCTSRLDLFLDHSVLCNLLSSTSMTLTGVGGRSFLACHSLHFLMPDKPRMGHSRYSPGCALWLVGCGNMAAPILPCRKTLQWYNLQGMYVQVVVGTEVPTTSTSTRGPSSRPKRTYSPKGPDKSQWEVRLSGTPAALKSGHQAYIMACGDDCGSAGGVGSTIIMFHKREV